ncbi:hypothetical protein FQA39_LY17530 [Lamprigera yunnana]|nr:hypothetical protein FQA39_LY17530 [Lamprigera yunnana]
MQPTHINKNHTYIYDKSKHSSDHTYINEHINDHDINTNMAAANTPNSEARAYPKAAPTSRDQRNTYATPNYDAIETEAPVTAEGITATNKHKQHNKPPSTLRRNRERALKYKATKLTEGQKISHTQMHNQTTQTDNRHTSALKRLWDSFKQHLICNINTINTVNTEMRQITLQETLNTINTVNMEMRQITLDETTTDKIENIEPQPASDRDANRSNPAHVYSLLEINYSLATLEDPKILTIALRHLVRMRHPKGKRITFPTIEAVDRITLKARGITTDVEGLQELSSSWPFVCIFSHKRMANISKQIGVCGKILRSQAREIVANIIEFMTQETKEGLTIPLSNFKERILAATR